MCVTAWRREHPDLKSLNHYSFGDSRGNRVDMLGVRGKETGVLRATFIVDPGNTIQHVSVNSLNVGRNPSVLRILDGLKTDELCHAIAPSGATRCNAKDIRLNIDGTMGRSSLTGNDAVGGAFAAAFAAKSPKIIDIISASGALSEKEKNVCLTASALMGITNVRYPYVEMTEIADLKRQPAWLRMTTYATNGGVDKRRFQRHALSASIIGKCQFCIKSHVDLLRREGMSSQQLRDIGRIAAVINASSQVIAAAN